MKTQSQIFDFGRFTLTLRHDIILNGKQLLLKILMMIATLSLINILFILNNTSEASQLETLGASFKFFCIVFCALGASLFMDDMKTNGQRLNAIMLPSSQLEKYLSRTIIYVVGVFVSYLLSFTIAELIRVGITYTIYGNLPGLRFFSIFEIIGSFEYPWLLFLCVFGIQWNFVLGSTIWPKNSFLKTFGALTVIQIVVALITSNVFRAVVSGKTFVKSVIITDGFGEQVMNILIVSTIILALFCMVTAYYRLKESEIINRF